METNLNFLLQPTNEMPSQNPINVLLDGQYTNAIENYVINSNIVYDKQLIIMLIAKSPDTTLVVLDETTNWKKGDLIFLQDRTANDKIYTGYYNVLEVVDTTRILIDLALTVPFIPESLGPQSFIFHYIKYKHVLSPDNQLAIDIQPILKDFVGSGLISTIDSSNFTGGKDTFEYDLIFGEEYNFVFQFQDNYFYSGNVGFVSNQYASVDDVPFEIGDQVNVSGIQQEWTFSVQSDNLGRLRLVHNSPHNFQAGDTVYVSGCQQYPEYNGYKKVYASVTSGSPYSIVLEQPFLGSPSTTEIGKVFGNPVPQYAGNATIINKIYVPGTGVVIVIDKPFDESTQALAGQIRLINNQKFGNLTKLSTVDYSGNTIRQIRHCRFDNEFLFKDANELKTIRDILNSDFVATNTTTEKYFSTILYQNGKYNKTTKNCNSHLLFRMNKAMSSFVRPLFALYTFYDKSNTQLGQAFINLNREHTLQIPTGLHFLVYDSINPLNEIGSFDIDAQFLNIDSFDIQIMDDVTISGNPLTSTKISYTIKFKIDNDCTGLDTTYNLIWLDSFGSYINYPFKYYANKTTEVDRKSYYGRKINYAGGQYVDDSAFKGNTEYYSKSRDKFKLTSGWLNDDENYLLQDLIKSIDVYVQIENKEMKRTFACSLENKNITYQTNYANSFIYNYTPSIVLANNDYRFNSYNQFLDILK